MFRKKKKYIYIDGAVTLVDHNLVKNIYSPKQIIEMMYAFFMYYNMQIGIHGTQRKDVTLYFHKKKKRKWIKPGLLIKSSLDFLLKTAEIFVYVFLVVIIVNIQTGGYSISKLTFRQILLTIGIDITTSYLICCMIILVRIHFQKVFGKFTMLGGLTRMEKEDANSFFGFVHIYEAHRLTKEKFLKFFFHELDHVLWELEGREFDFTKYYNEQPHEIRAFRRGDGWKETVLTSENKIANDLSY